MGRRKRRGRTRTQNTAVGRQKKRPYNLTCGSLSVFCFFSTNVSGKLFSSNHHDAGRLVFLGKTDRVNGVPADTPVQVYLDQFAFPVPVPNATRNTTHPLPPIWCQLTHSPKHLLPCGSKSVSRACFGDYRRGTEYLSPLRPEVCP